MTEGSPNSVFLTSAARPLESVPSTPSFPNRCNICLQNFSNVNAILALFGHRHIIIGDLVSGCIDSICETIGTGSRSRQVKVRCPCCREASWRTSWLPGDTGDHNLFEMAPLGFANQGKQCRIGTFVLCIHIGNTFSPV